MLVNANTPPVFWGETVSNVEYGGDRRDGDRNNGEHNL